MDFFPFFRRPYYYSDPFQNRYMQNQYQIRRKREEKQKNRESKINETQTNNINIPDKVESRNNENSQKILGFNSDDILIIVLLLFLYNEGVRDNMLFLVLILLLLT